ncbi:hypothetical protein [Aminobacter phage Erebus]|nr:hypothetical protein [Aminobacter phage Erebus]
MTEEPTILPEGNYLATILEFGSLTLSQTKPGVFRMPIQLDVAGQVVFTMMFGYPAAMQALRASRSFWEGEKVNIRCRHRKHEGRLHTDIDVTWEKAR